MQLEPIQLVIGVMFIIMAATPITAIAQQNSPHKVAIAIHGGAGVITRGKLSPEREQAIRQKLDETLRAGHGILLDGGTSLDAVATSVQILEDSPLFNAGKGAVYTAQEKHELDAAIMDGATLKAGAVAAVTRVKNPIELARLVMEQSKHVLLVGSGAEQFATERGVHLVQNSYFDTPERLEALHKEQAAERGGSTQPSADSDKHGTVGAVALDRHGNLAAATSTGGMTNKLRPGGRFADHWGGHVGRKRHLRRVCDGPRRVLHPRGFGP